MEITRSAKKSAARAEKLGKIAKGVSTGVKKDKAVKAIGKNYYKKVRKHGGSLFCQTQNASQAPQMEPDPTTHVVPWPLGSVPLRLALFLAAWLGF